jgi:hypothetical protein
MSHKFAVVWWSKASALDDGHKSINAPTDNSGYISRQGSINYVSLVRQGGYETSELVRGCQILEHFLGYSLKKFYKIETSCEEWYEKLPLT